MKRSRALMVAVLLLAITLLSGTAAGQHPADWTEPFPPFHIVGNLYYVGSKALASYLIVTPQGNILINSDLEANVPLIRNSIEKLGYKFGDIKILLISHAHLDHDAASALIKKQTGARYMVMDADVSVVESGGKTDYLYGAFPKDQYAPTKVDRALHNGDEVRLGDSVLVAHLTAGHTKGCTTWTMKVAENGKSYDVVIVGGPYVNEGTKLIDNAKYPNIVADFARTFEALKSLPCDYFLGAHGSYFDMETKFARLNKSAENPFIDPEGYKNFVNETEQDFQKELLKQKASASHTIP